MRQDTNTTIQTIKDSHAVHVAHHTPRFDTATPKLLLQPPDSLMTVDTLPQTDDYLLLCNDSVFAKYNDCETQYRESMFLGNSHSSAEPPQPILGRQKEGYSGWFFGTIVLMLAIVSIFINSRRFKLKEAFQSLFDRRVLERVLRENNVKMWSLLPMTGIYIACLALTVVRATDFSGIHTHYSELQLFLASFAGIAAFILVKNSLIRLIGNVFNDSGSTSLYVANSHFFFLAGGLVLTPLQLLSFYGSGLSSTSLKISTFFIAILFIVRLLRGIPLILSNSKTSKLYLFYYLCIFEIVPILVMVKLLLD
ncbi:MAG: DUF4271 domain-containing protein [Bacteroidales bacterium]|nr:DUF4271 domain-containing protein [Bacteroidales bacterium]